MKFYDGTKRAVTEAATADLSELLLAQVQLVECESRTLAMNIHTMLTVQAELARRGVQLGFPLKDALAFVTVIETGLDKKLQRIANNEYVPERPADYSGN